MKERLTKRDKNEKAVVFNYTETAGEFKEVVDRLCEYEDLEEQGLIVRLPCKVRDMEERITNGDFYPEIEFCTNCKYYGEPNGCNHIEGSCDNYDVFVESYNKLRELENGLENG